MSSTVTIQLEKPIASATLTSEAPGDCQTGPPETKLTEPDGRQNGNLTQLCQALQDAADKLKQFYENIFKEHKEQIAKLSVEIARKILVQKAQDGDYQIESIIKEALKNSPTPQDVVVHLNPEDLDQYQRLKQDGADANLSSIKFVADQNIGRAECLLETPKGMVESLIDGHLEQISKTLKQVE